ncbi:MULTISPECIES: efflux RND transporter permease subunit [Methylosinus]|uniref:Nodulation protein n=1 Tax=Methylosinus trichosporium (strain ATCC 35070 / NCIMB 11131 / UNIQEM 75 / OB3b) TaxID=595536 RepID=A0A2D2CYU1_METT3|nr:MULTISPECIES: efflux RND transporter permease subunit [Methylosinus]ATQ67900.1 nodulation protein [Methylosinus trichosporium OB3b]OBS51272.1 nodulation protein [Methylosinus sp. 3S-1]
MNISAPFILRPVATTLLTIALTLAGALAFMRLPVAPLPQIDSPTVAVSASLPGASPETVATSVAGPLERRLGAIADVAEMTSSSSAGQTNIVLQFGLDRDIDGAVRDVQAAINAAAADLPSGLSSNPTYHKFNPADTPVLILALTSNLLTRAQLFEAASNVLQQRLSQLPGVGQVSVSGGAAPAVRVELIPAALFKYGVGLEDVRAALASANANSPKGDLSRGEDKWQIYANDQASRAADYRNLVVAYRNGNSVRLSDLGEVVDSVADLRNAALVQGKPAILVTISRQPGANIIETVDRIKAELPKLAAGLPSDVEIILASDRSTTIRASLHDTELTLVIAIALVILVVFLFIGEWRAAFVPAIAVPVSIIGAFTGMYFLGYSLDILSLMALTIATGFVVDDAIVVLETIERHIEAGTPRREAALKGAREVGFTVLSISLSLIAVFIPLLLMGGMLGRMFREFAVTLSITILVSLVVSLTTTPMLCSIVLRAKRRRERRWTRPFSKLATAYERSLIWALYHRGLIMAALVGSIALTIGLFAVIPKGFFPEQDTGRLRGSIQADQGISFQAMSAKLAQFVAIVQSDPAVDVVTGSTGAGGGGSANTGSVSVSLKPLSERNASAAQVVERLRPKLGEIAGARLFLSPVQELRSGGRQSDALYQYTLFADSSAELVEWTRKLTAALQESRVVVDLNSDEQQNGVETYIDIDRDTMSRLGLTPVQVDDTLYDAFGQRQVSTIYSDLDQYHVVMEAAPRYQQDPQILREIYVSAAVAPVSGSAASIPPTGAVTAAGSASSATTSAALDAARNAATNAIANSGRGGAAVITSFETMTPLVAFARFRRGATPLAINHQGSFVASTIAFNLAIGASLSDAVAEFDHAVAEIRMPASVHGGMQGTARTFQESSDKQPLLIVMAIVTVYIVLGMLCESYVHPITILSTLPSAGVGALLALFAFGSEFGVIALIGLFLLIGIVKKNAIMMIDFALDARRSRGLSDYDAIVEACRLRFRPIMMTTAAALLGALPLMASVGAGSEIRRPLGITIVGGLLLSQLLTLYTTPVLFLTFNDLRDSIASYGDIGVFKRIGRWK